MSESATKIIILAAAASLLASCAYPPTQPYGSTQAGCASASPAGALAPPTPGTSAAYCATAPGPAAPCYSYGAYPNAAYQAPAYGAGYAPGFDGDWAGYGGLGTYNDFYGPDYGGVGFDGGGFYGGGYHGGGGFHGGFQGGGGHGGGGGGHDR